jgi:hypothetical protein
VYIDLWFAVMSDTTITPKPKRKGNYKPGPGRPPGRKNNKTLALEKAMQDAVAQIDGAFDGDAHAFLQAVYRNPDVPLEVRIMAAGRALRVEKPTLTASRSTVDVHVNMADRLEAARRRVDRLDREEALPELELVAEEV